MDSNRFKGVAKQVKGSLKDAAGKLTGSTKLRAEGKVEKFAGKVQGGYGKLKDKLRGR